MNRGILLDLEPVNHYNYGTKVMLDMKATKTITKVGHVGCAHHRSDVVAPKVQKHLMLLVFYW